MTGPALGQEPTGKKLDITGQHMVRFADGKVVEEWITYDTLGLIQQLGLQPPG